jgi:hypothetical protein
MQQNKQTNIDDCEEPRRVQEIQMKPKRIMGTVIANSSGNGEISALQQRLNDHFARLPENNRRHYIKSLCERKENREESEEENEEEEED